MAYIEV